MKYEPEKNEPKTMKAKADLMAKRGSISDKERAKLHAKADVEISKAKKPKPDADAEENEGVADPTQTPAKRAAATKKPVLRGQPLDEEERDL